MTTPKETRPKKLPDETIIDNKAPAELSLNKEQPTQTRQVETVPEETPKVETKPEETPKLETTPNPSPKKEEMPSDLIEENCVIVEGQKIEIKPTKLKYFRNKAASAYGIIKVVPLHELLTYGKGVLDENRDADQLLYDFLVAAFDDPTFVRDHYDNLDTETIERIIKIFGRLNHIDEKEEQARKNKEAQAAKR